MTALNLFGPVNQTGFGVHFTHWATIAAELMQGEAVILPRGNQVALPSEPNELTVIQHRLFKFLRPDEYDPTAPSISLWFGNNTWEFCGSKRYLYTVWEGTSLPGSHLRQMNKMDGLIVPTQWHARYIRQTLGLDTWVIPEGFCPVTFKCRGTGLKTFWTSQLDIQDHEQVLLNVGKFERRKGVEALAAGLEICAREKMLSAPLVVICHWNNPFMPNWPIKAGQLFRNHGFRDQGTSGTHVEYTNGDVRVIVLPSSSLPLDRLTALYRTAHFGIWPYYAEGWCLPMIESMACGLIPICQFYSGPTEYLNKKGAYVKNFIEIAQGQDVLANDGMWFRGDQGTWRQLQGADVAAAIQVATDMDEPTRVELANEVAMSVNDFDWDQKPSESTEAVLEDLGVRT